MKGNETQLRDFFDRLELEYVIPELLRYLYRADSCNNVIWILAEEFKTLHDAKETHEWEPEQQMHRHLRLQAIKPIDEAAIRLLANNFERNLSMSSRVTNDSGGVIAWPILSLESKTPMAYILMTEIKKLDIEQLQSRVGSELSQMAKHIGFSIQHWRAQRLSFLDDLTGLYNQKYLSLVLDHEILHCQRFDKKFSVLFMDVDFFKSVNDTRGHWIGSHLLVEIGRNLKQILRRSDYAFRYGGDEFVAILPMTSAEGAKVTAERIRSCIETTDFAIDGQHLKLTISLGLATYPDHAKTHKDIIKMADEAMYCGKHKSRNVVFVAS